MDRLFKQLSSDGYIAAIGRGTNGVEVDAAEYAAIDAAIKDKPTAEAGYSYRLRDDLTWERVEAPTATTEESGERYTEDELSAMTNAELEVILAGYGVSASMTKANLIRLILSLQEGDEDGLV